MMMYLRLHVKMLSRSMHRLYRMRKQVVWVAWLLKLKDDVTTVSESFNLHLDDVANVVELSQLLNRIVICDDPACSNVE